MPRFESERRATAFLTGADGVPRGTAFFIRIPEQSGSVRAWFTYLVTAAHVVRSAPDESFVRLKHAGCEWDDKSAFTDVPVSEWTFHDDPAVDVAVAPLQLPDGSYEYDSLMAPEEDDPAWRASHRGRELALIQPGDNVYFIGLLGQVEEMGARSIPMVRSGVIGATWQKGVPLEVGANTTLMTTAHLIDAHAHAGFSGSPCFVHRWRFEGELAIGVGPPDPEAFRRREDLILIGLIRGHFPLRQKLEVSGPYDAVDGTASVALNAGVAVVVPAPFIREVLMREELVKERRARHSSGVRQDGR